MVYLSILYSANRSGYIKSESCHSTFLFTNKSTGNFCRVAERQSGPGCKHRMQFEYEYTGLHSYRVQKVNHQGVPERLEDFCHLFIFLSLTFTADWWRQYITQNI